MTPQQEIFKLALKQHPLSLALVAAGVKPSSYCQVKVSKSLINKIDEQFVYQSIKEFPGVGFYVFPQWLSMKDKSDKIIQLMIFNDQALQEILPILNQSQYSFNFKNANDIRLTNIGFYKLVRTKKNWSPTMKQDVTVVCGLSFGFPEQSTLKFGAEVLIEKMVAKRTAYEIKQEKNLVFIGYPETKDESEKTITKWYEFKKSKKYQSVVSQLELI